MIGAPVSGQHWHADSGCEIEGGVLAAHDPHGSRRRADEAYSRLLARFGEVGILGEKSVTGVQRVGATAKAGVDNGRNVEVALGGGCRSDAKSFVSQIHVQCVRVRVRIDRDGANTEAPGRAHDAAGYLAAIGDQDLMKAGAQSRIQAGGRLSRNAVTPSRPSWDARCDAMRCATSPST